MNYAGPEVASVLDLGKFVLSATYLKKASLIIHDFIDADDSQSTRSFNMQTLREGRLRSVLIGQEINRSLLPKYVSNQTVWPGASRRACLGRS